MIGSSSFFYAYFGVLASEGKGDFFNIKAYLPGTGDTVIIKAVPPGELLLLAEFSLSIVFVRWMKICRSSVILWVHIEIYDYIPAQGPHVKN